MSKEIEFIVFAPPYSPDIGGFVVLHYLCHLLNEIGYEASLIPRFDSCEVSAIDDLEKWHADLSLLRCHVINSPFFVNPNWKTPLYRHPLGEIRNRDDIITIYPESSFGNPLRARNVVRWILHEPGFHGNRIFYGPGEVHFRYLEMHRAIPMPWIEIADQLLTVSHIPWESYKPPSVECQRSGTAYIIRKGANKPLIHDLSNSVQVDGMSHAEIGEICRRVKTFISYDTKTLYSALAAIAGADSVVVPDQGISMEEWQPEPSLRRGISYGFAGVEKARQERPLLLENLLRQEKNSRLSVEEFVSFCEKRMGRVNSRDNVS